MLVFRVALFICRYDDVAYFFTDIFRGIFSTRNSCIGAYENVSGCIYCRLTRIFHCFPPSFCRLFHFPYVVGCLVSENLADFGDVLDSPGGGGNGSLVGIGGIFHPSDGGRYGGFVNVLCRFSDLLGSACYAVYGGVPGFADGQSGFHGFFLEFFPQPFGSFAHGSGNFVSCLAEKIQGVVYGRFVSLGFCCHMRNCKIYNIFLRGLRYRIFG